MSIKRPYITSITPEEQVAQIKSYLYQLVEELNWQLDTIKKDTYKDSVEESTDNSIVKQETQSQDNFNEIKSLIIKSADIVNSYYNEINNLLKLSGEYVAESDYGLFKQNTESLINASDTKIESLVTRTETIERDITSVKQSQTEIKQTANNVEILVNNINDNGAKKVTTTTGHTFDENGLKISKSGEEMQNLLDNTGMYVKRNNENMLKANNDGVDAKNLKASTYLIIGGRSRLENYGQNRTGCFWVE